MTLGKRLNLTYAERARLLLRTIGPCDVTEKAMALMRKQNKRKRDKQRRLAEGVETRADYLAKHTTSKEKPWLKLGIKRSTWYAKHRWTGLRHIKLAKTELALVQKENEGSTASECERLPTPTPAGQTQTCPEFLTADEASWLVDAICPPVTNVELAAA